MILGIIRIEFPQVAMMPQTPHIYIRSYICMELYIYITPYLEDHEALVESHLM